MKQKTHFMKKMKNQDQKKENTKPKIKQLQNNKEKLWRPQKKKT